VMQGVLEDVGIKLARAPRQVLTSLLYRRAMLRMRGLGHREHASEEIAPDVKRKIDACWSVVTGLSLVDPIRAQDFQARHLLYSLKAGEPFRLTRALSLEVGYATLRGASAEARSEEVIRNAEALAEKVNTPHARGFVAGMRAARAYLLARWPESAEQADLALRIFRGECTNVAWEIATTLRFSLLSLFYAGDLEELCRRAPQYYADALQRGDRHARYSAASGSAITAWLAQGESRAAEQILDDIEEVLSSSYFALPHLRVIQARNFVDFYARRGDRALARYQDVWPDIERSMLLRVQVVRITAYADRAMAALASRDDACLALAEKDAKRLQKERSAFALVMARLIQACVHERRGDVAAAIEGFDGAESGFSALSMPLYQQACAHRGGTLQGGDQGTATTKEATATLQTHGIKDPPSMLATLIPA